MFGRRFIAVAIAASLFGATGCEYTQNRETQTGALIGAGSGALLGGIVGHQTGHTGEGALIGAAAGGLLGGGIGYAMERQRKQFQAQLANTNARIDEIKTAQGQPSLLITMPNQVLFEFDSSQLRPQAMDSLDQVASVIRDPQYRMPSRIIVHGHTDNVGQYDYNIRLSQARAEAVRSYLISRGISASILEARGWGPDRPVASNATETDRALNRRVEIQIIQ